jgi:2-polyprenyl-3-methyl-5-hydroxy-6-metoxy-1,4-benzoquinol methylase/GNAT superfamily N-acetyltransferase
MAFFGNNVETTFKWLIGREVSESLLQECSKLFGEHYGIWSREGGDRAGKRVRRSPEKIQELLNDENAGLAIALSKGQLVAYAAAVQIPVGDHEKMTWVTQLVVHSDFRQQGIAKRLLFAIWGFSDHFAWGLVTANPYTVRALEKATRRRVLPYRIKEGIQVLLSDVKGIPYITPEIEVACDECTSRINTNFFVDHSDVPQMVQRVSVSTPWEMGALPEGWEWLAFTFRDQAQIELSADEVKQMIKVSDSTTAIAYARMTMDKNHAWRKHIAHEVDFIWKHCNLRTGSTVLDVGCGDGRHLLELGRKDVSGTGLDYVESRINAVNLAAKVEGLHTRFLAADARDIDLREEFDRVLCVYDVIGSYADDSENLRIAKTVAKHVKQGGTALISVMNLDATAFTEAQKFSIEREPDRLLHLQASRIMETSGNVFDPQFLMLDPESKVVYRREQFTEGSALPAELLVRDRRFQQHDIEEMCRLAGLTVVWSRFVRAGQWEIQLNSTDHHAKEILLLCTKV